MTGNKSDIFLERHWDPPLTDADFWQMVAEGADCMQMHRVGWESSLMSTDGRRLVCHFHAPDAESARIALRQLGVDLSVMWAGTVHDAPGVTASEVTGANVAVTRCFEAPVALDEIQATEDGASHCLETHRVHFVRSCFSTDRRRMICLYRAPDAESVRMAQREAQMPVDSVWAFRRYAP